MSPIVGDKQTSTPCNKRGHVIPKFSSADPSAKRGEELEPKLDQEVDKTLIFEGASNLNLIADHNFIKRVECVKKDANVVLPNPSDKSIQGEVHHASSHRGFQTDIVSPMIVMPQHVVPSAAICDELLDSGAESLCLPQKFPIVGNNSEDDSTSIDASLESFENVKDDYLAASIVVPVRLERIMNDETYSYVAPQDDDDDVHQYL